MEVEGVPLQMEVDTGATVSLISGETKGKLFPVTKVVPSKAALKTYTGEQMFDQMPNPVFSSLTCTICPERAHRKGAQSSGRGWGGGKGGV